MKARHAANDGGIIGVTAIAVDLAPVSKDPLDVIQGVGPLRMPGQLCFFPRTEVCRDLFAQGVDSLIELLNLAPRVVGLPGDGLQFGKLLFDLSQFLLRFESGIHLAAVTVPGGPSRLHHRQEELSTGHH